MDDCIDAINYCAKVHIETRSKESHQAFIYWVKRYNALKEQTK
jgi:hypothetical protein